jgi:3-methyladenine DNA glycosylase AlkC
MHHSERIRRFAVEILRPRGVWCSSIKQLRATPWLAQSIIEPLKADPSLYVQKSVGNWLNDAAKDHPQWVDKLIAKWLNESQTKSTLYIAKRALRSIKK